MLNVNEYFGLSTILTIAWLFGVHWVHLIQSNAEYVVTVSKLKILYCVIFNVLTFFSILRVFFSYNIWTLWRILESTFQNLSQYIGVITAMFCGYMKPHFLNTFVKVLSEVDQVIGYRNCYSSEKKLTLLLISFLAIRIVLYCLDTCYIYNGDTDCLTSLSNMVVVVPSLQLCMSLIVFVYIISLLTLRLNAVVDYIEEISIYMSYSTDTEQIKIDDGNLYLDEDFIRKEFPKINTEESKLIRQVIITRTKTAVYLIRRIYACAYLLAELTDLYLTAYLGYAILFMFILARGLLRLDLPAAIPNNVKKIIFNFPSYYFVKQAFFSCLMIVILTESCHNMYIAHERLIDTLRGIAKMYPSVWMNVLRFDPVAPVFTSYRVIAVKRTTFFKIFLLVCSVSILAKQIKHDKEQLDSMSSGKINFTLNHN